MKTTTSMSQQELQVLWAAIREWDSDLPVDPPSVEEVLRIVCAHYLDLRTELRHNAWERDEHD